MTATANLSPDDASRTGLPTRPLGKTGVRVSILALGGWHIGAVPDKAEAVRMMHTALDEGLNIFDNAWDYHDGGSEEIMGQALSAPGKRAKTFLMTKNCGRDAKETRQHLEDSLRRLKTDYLDLWQFHEINYDNDPDWIVERGALAEALKAQKEGKVRFLGFTGHKSPHILRKMLPLHMWDTVQMPINVCDYFFRSFLHEVVPEANRHGAGVIGMKCFGGTKARIVNQGVCTAEEALRFSLSQPIATVVVGIDSMDLLLKNIAIVRAFRPLEAAEMEQLLAKAKAAAGDGRFELFKTAQVFDGPYHRAQHALSQRDVE